LSRSASLSMIYKTFVRHGRSAGGRPAGRSSSEAERRITVVERSPAGCGAVSCWLRSGLLLVAERSPDRSAASTEGLPLEDSQNTCDSEDIRSLRCPGQETKAQHVNRRLWLGVQRIRFAPLSGITSFVGGWGATCRAWPWGRHNACPAWAFASRLGLLLEVFEFLGDEGIHFLFRHLFDFRHRLFADFVVGSFLLFARLFGLIGHFHLEKIT